VTIRASTQAGLFYGVQTLLQLLPPQVYAPTAASGVHWTVPCVRIEDQPRFKWRGLMLDVSRHFYTKEQVEQILDSMAAQKLNTFHWHLVDDPGWRIEIKRYPLLTEVGAWRRSIGFDLDPKSSTAYGPDGRYGGYYTQADIREVIAYASARHITIVPEIEMPGHSSAALAAYPQFSCSGGPYTTDVNGGVLAGVYCAGNDLTFEFLQNILGEVIDLFPGKYIHIGGDEVPKENWQKCAKCQARMSAEKLGNEKELQSYFIRRIEKFINSRGRNLIGWSEIREGGLAKNAAVMDWIGGAVEAASDGHDVVMSPTSNCYFDYYQSTNHATEPKAIGGFLPLDMVYALDPMPAALDLKFAAHILGAQGNLWTEFVPSPKHAQYMIYPRLCAIAEITWSPKTGRDYADFTHRLQTQFRRFDQMGINYRKEIPPAK
jgi:hexosaminidase